MADIKTGNKGFVNPADGNKVYTMDSVAPGAPSVNDSPPAYDPGNMSVDNTVRDISKKTRITLGTYLSKVTKGEAGSTTRPNKYTIDPSTDGSMPSSITTQGYPTPLGPSENTSQFKPVLPGSVSNDYSTIQNAFKKGKAPDAVPDGNQLLPQATGSDQSKQLVPNGPVDKYTAAATTPNRWSTGGSGFTAGADPSAPSNSFDVPLQSTSTYGQSSTASTAYTLDLSARVAKAESETSQNAIDPIPSAVVNQTSITTNQVPTPLAPTTHGFAPNLPSSFSNDYASSDLTGLKGLQKGKTSEEGPDGNEFTAKVVIANKEIKEPEKLATYTAEAISPNRFKAQPSGIGFSSSAEVDSPPRTFDIPLQSYTTAVMPNEEVTDAANTGYGLDLAARTLKPVSITAGNTYPVTTPSLTPSYSTEDPVGFPASLTPPINQNSNSDGPQVHDPELRATPTPQGIKKGKTPDDSALDGHVLLSDSIVERNGSVDLPAAINDYSTQKLTDNNEFLPSGPLLPTEIDLSSPPDTYNMRLLEIDAKGEFVDAEKRVVLLNDLRKVPSEITTKNSFPITDDLPPLSPTTDKATGLPSPLLPFAASERDSYYVPQRDIKPLSSDPSIQNLSKGKSQVDAKYDGDNLLLTLKGNKSVGNPDDKYLVEGAGLNYEGSRGGFIGNKDPKDSPVFTYKGGAGSPNVLNNTRFVSFGPGGMPQANFNPAYKLSSGQSVSSLKFAQLGAGLSQRAAAEIPAWISDPSSKFDPNGSLAELGAILPSVNQLGILKVDDLLLTAKDTFDSIDGTFPGESLTEISPFGGQSWGNLNSVSEPYDDAFSLGLFITTLLMIIALKILFFVFGLPFPNETHVRSDATGAYTLGKYKYKDESSIFGLSFLPNWYELFGVEPTQNPFGEALDAGTNAYFVGAENYDAGIGDFLLAAIGIGDFFKDDRKMYTALMTCRTIVRSAFLLAVALERIAKSPNIATGIKAALSIFRLLRASRFIKAVNVFSALGDQILVGTKSAVPVVGPDGKTIMTPIAASSPADSAVHASVSRSRIGSSLIHDPTLAWSSQRSPSLYLLNHKISNAQSADVLNKLGSFKGMQALDYSKSPASGNSRAKVYGSLPSGPRIDAATRTAIENKLEAEYVPFYFHDVRTNEIISFHAFLASLSDDFTAAYDSVEGFGRVEGVKIYKNTSRKIGMSFHIVSTSPTDFDHMWHKINKLTTMIYPQYTRGKQLIGDKFQFTAPFSQMIGASPLIRIRLGDLIRSNYSRFALARLFGLMDGDAKIIAKDGSEQSITYDSAKDYQEGQDKLEKRLKEFKTGDKVTVMPAIASLERYDVYRALQDEIDKQVAVGSEIRNSIPTGGSFGNVNISVNKDKTLSNIPFSAIEYVVTDTILDVGGNSHELEIQIKNQAGNVLQTAAIGPLFIDGERIRIHSKYLKHTREDAERIRSEIASNTMNGLVSDFMDPTRNSITKSFESAGGRGLAGFIESMNFDWYNATTWEIQPGSTAPKVCKVTISFSPIHDITPGIDHTGYNRAPIYAVGDAMRSAPVALEQPK